MQIGMVGLGRMGGNMARRLLRGGHEVVAYAADANAVRQLAGEGAVGALTLDDFVAKLKAPRVAGGMGPAGPPAAEHGYLYCGPAGAGHFVKMVHNGIEYGLMQAYAEGLDIMKNANSKDLPEELRYDLDLADIAELWRRGSVVSSWLLDLTAQALAENPTLSAYTGVVADSGEGRWTIMAALEEAVPCDVLAASLFARFRSRRDHTFAEKVLSAMRHKFGGHVEQPTGG